MCNTKNSTLLILLICGITNFSLAQVTQSRYISSEGDSLSCIAEKYLGYPVYGSEGSLNTLITYNNSIDNEDLIQTGKIIVLPNEQSAESFRKPETLSPLCKNGASRFASDNEVLKLRQKLQELNEAENKEIAQLKNRVTQLEQSLAALKNQQEEQLLNTPPLKPSAENSQNQSDKNVKNDPNMPPPLDPYQSPWDKTQNDEQETLSSYDKASSGAATKTSVSESKSENNAAFYGGFGLLFHKIKGEDTVNTSFATLLSDLSWQLELGWKTPMNSRSEYYSHMNVKLRSYRYSENTQNFNVIDDAVLAPDITLGIGRNTANNKLGIELYTGAYRQIHFFTPNPVTIELSGDWVGKAGLMADIKLVTKKSSFGVGVRPSLQIIGLGDFIDDGGLVVNAELYTKYFHHELNLSYKYATFESSNSQFHTDQLGMMYRMYF